MNQTRSLSVITPRATGAVTLAEAKNWLRVDHAADDALIGQLVTAAHDAVEDYCGLTLVTTTLEAQMDRIPLSGAIDLPRGPVASVVSLTTVAPDGTDTVAPGALWVLDARSWQVFPAPGHVWPGPLRRFAAVRVRYIAGQAASAVPAPLRMAVLHVLSSLYDKRDGAPEMPVALLASWRRLDDCGWRA